MIDEILKKIRKPGNILLAILFLVFVLKGYVFLDPDFGWRIRAGEMYFSQGIPQKDPFSYTMPSFPWVDHAFSQSAFYYLVFSNIGYLGLSVIVSFFAVASLHIMSLKL